MCHSPIAATDVRDSYVHPMDFEDVHLQGIPHRAVHVEIENEQGEYFVWHRDDGRLEIPGGHVDWLEGESRSESYEEAAMREVTEELMLPENWRTDIEGAHERMKGRLIPTARTVNQVPSSHGSNNEWVTVYRLRWQSEWGDPCDARWKLSEEGASPRWLNLEGIERYSVERPMQINAALRLFLRRRGVLVPLISRSRPYSHQIC